MDAKVREYTEAKVKELIGAYSCCAEAKAAGQAWLDAAGTDQEAEKKMCIRDRPPVNVKVVER